MSQYALASLVQEIDHEVVRLASEDALDSEAVKSVFDRFVKDAPSTMPKDQVWAILSGLVAAHSSQSLTTTLADPLGPAPDDTDWIKLNYDYFLENEMGFIGFAHFYDVVEGNWPRVEDHTLYYEGWAIISYIYSPRRTDALPDTFFRRLADLCQLIADEPVEFVDRRPRFEALICLPYVQESPFLLKVVQYVYGGPSSQNSEPDEGLMSLVGPLAVGVAEAEKLGLHHSLATIGAFLGNRDLINDDPGEFAIAGLQSTTAAHEFYLERTAVVRNGLAWLSFQWVKFREHAHLELPWVTEVVDAMGRLLEKMSAVVASLGSIAGSMVLSVIQHHTSMSKADLLFLTSITLDVLSSVDPRHRVNHKAVWALLWHKARAKMTRAEEMFFSLPVSHFRPSADYGDWSSRMCELMRGVPGADVDTLFRSAPSREVFFPSTTYGLHEYEQWVDKGRTRFVETTRERERYIQSVALGNEIAIDQAYLATAFTAQSSLDRYVVPRPVVSVEDRLLLRETADAMYEEYKDIYELPKPMTVGAVLSASVWKYSAGLPFLPVIRQRATLQRTAWYAAINRAAQAILNGGVFPEVGFHGFPKAQVVALSKLEDRSKLRTVTAGDRITATAVNTLLLERNKRVAPIDYLVLNQIPRREGAFNYVFNKISEDRDFVARIDGRAFDSTVAAEVATIGSVRLYERGIQDANVFNARAAVSIVHAYYEALCHGLIVNLMSGQVIRKTGGGGTGSAATTPDNRDWTRLVLIASFSKTFNVPPADFFKHVTIGNASDDAILGLKKEHAERLHEWLANCRDMFGVEFNFNVTDVVEEVIHLEAVVLSETDIDMYDAVGTAPPTHPLRHSPQRLMLMRSAYRSDRMTTNILRACQVLVESATGHALLTAHSPETYSLVAQDYMEAATELMSCFYTDFAWTIGHSSEGHVNSVHPHFGTEYTSRFLRQAMARTRSKDPSSPAVLEYCRRFDRANRRWLKARPLKSYFEVFRLWTKPEVWNRQRPAHKRWNKVVPYARFSTPFVDLIRLGLVRGQRFFDNIPHALKTLSPEAHELAFSRPFMSYDYIVEMFILRKFCRRNGRLPSDAEFRSEIRKSPFASATDLQSFLIRLSSPRVLVLWASLSADSVPDADKKYWISNDAVQGRLFCLLFWYTIIDIVMNRLVSVPLLGIVVLLFSFWVRYLDQVYSILGLAYWVATGTASIAIANITPRDKYLVQKQVAAILAGLTPRVLTDHWIGVFSFAGYLEVAVDALTYLWHVRSTVETQVLKALSAESNPWIPFLAGVGFGTQTLDHDLITGGTGLGKSTSMIATLISHFLEPRVVLLVPYNVLVQSYTNDFLERRAIHLHRAGDPFELGDYVRLVVCTYTAALGEPKILEWGTAIIGDEYHAAPFSTIIIEHVIGPKKFIAVTATPEGPFCLAKTKIAHAPSVNRFEREERVLVEDMVNVLESLHTLLPEPSSRVLVIHPSRAQLETWHNAVVNLGFTSSILTAGTGDPSVGQVLFATTVVDNGINILPPPALLIDSGVSLIRSRNGTNRDECYQRAYKMHLRPSPRAIVAQRAGRVGRISKGLVLRLCAEVGKPDLISVDWAHYLKYLADMGNIRRPPIQITARRFSIDDPLFEFERGITLADKVLSLMAVVVVSNGGGLIGGLQQERIAMFAPDGDEAQSRQNAHSAACAILNTKTEYPTYLLPLQLLLPQVGLPVSGGHRTTWYYNTFWRLTDSNEITVV